MWSLTTVLHLLQPLARLRGRFRFGLTPWRRRGWHGLVFPWPQTVTLWSEQWQAPEAWLRGLEERMKEGAVVLRGGDYDRWDLAVRGGSFGSAHMLMTVEEHGGGRQLIRFRLTPRLSISWFVITAGLMVLATGAALDRAWPVAAVMGALAVVLAVWGVLETGASMSSSRAALLTFDGHPNERTSSDVSHP
jgi:hypothetical protein